jgi:transposase-like protein
MSNLQKKMVECAFCGASILRRTWNPNKHRPILQSYCDMTCKAEWQRTQKPVTRDWLVQKYEVEKLDCHEIAKIVSRDPKRVWEWLRDYGIQTRPRGSELAKQWARGDRVHPGGFPHSPETKEKIRQDRLRDGRVPYLTRDGIHYMRGRRGHDHHGWKGGLTHERSAVATTDEWKAAVKSVWARADAKCELCGKDHRTINRVSHSFDIHHIISFQYRPTRTEVSNLVLLCEPCHYFVHSTRNVDRILIAEIPNAGR